MTTSPARSFEPKVTRAQLPPLSAELFERRRARLLALARAEGAGAVLVTSGSAGFAYLVGEDFGRSERLIALVLPAEGSPVIVAPAFEVSRVKKGAKAVEVRGWEEWESPSALVAQVLGERARTVMVDPHTEAFVMWELTRRAPHLTLSDGTAAFEALRVVKVPEELERMRLATVVMEEAIADTFERLASGLMERDVARIIREELSRRGVEGGALVQFGASSAMPHGGPGDVRLTEDMVVLIDGGCSVEGWKSDITRTRWFGGAPSPRFVELYNTVHDAQSAALELVRPGVGAAALDEAARAVIERAGFGRYFTHRLGHGIGMDGHEAAYLVRGSEVKLQPGYVFTIEPGIYVPGELGVRLEDDVACGEDGAILLSRRAPRL